MGLNKGRGRWRVAGALAVSLTVPLMAPSSAGADEPSVPTTEVVVGLGSHVVQASSVLAGLPGRSPTAAPGGRYLLRVPAGEVPGVLAQLRTDQRVAYASVPQRVHATDIVPDDPGLVRGGQQDLYAVHAPQGWGVTEGDPAVTVAVLDTGVDAAHADLAGKVVVGPNECISDDPLCAGGGDPDGHGSHVTGTVAAATNNGVGVASLGWNTRAEVFKVLDSEGNGSTFDLANGIYDAINSGARVVNMSLGNDSCDVNPGNCGIDPDLQAAVTAALARGVVVVVAAGNDASNQPTYPAGFPGVLSVAATDNSGVVQSFSQWGAAADIAAPGVGILSTWNDGGYAALTGTSMAAPHVAAAAALVLSVNPSLSGAQVTSLLESTASKSLSGPHLINGGLLDTYAAVETAVAIRPPAPVGYQVAGADGSVYAFGASTFHGDLAGVRLNRPVVGVASKVSGPPDCDPSSCQTGYWLAASDGGVFTFGDARFFGSTGSIRLNRPVVGMAATPDGGGYWLVASDGGIFTFGDARFFGSTGGIRLNQPVVGMAATPDGGGYWLVASDGGVFSFGDARFFGSTGGVRLNKPIVGMAAGTAGGYWLVASDGGVFTFGTSYYGSTGNLRLNKPIVGIEATPSEHGYWLAASDGGIFAFGDAGYLGSTGAQRLAAAAVGIAF